MMSIHSRPTITTLALGLGLLGLGSGHSLAGDVIYAGSSKDYGGPVAVPVPAPMPIPEPFTYYLRADLGYGFSAKKPTLTETGNLFGNETLPYRAQSSFAYGDSPFSSTTAVDSFDDIFTGGIGFGAYLTPRFRSDITLDFRGTQSSVITGNYAYASWDPTTASATGDTVVGTARDMMRVRGTVALVNGYWDLLPRGRFTPYVGAGVGMVFNTIERFHNNTEDVYNACGGVCTSREFAAEARKTQVGLAAAFTAGFSYAFDHRMAFDLNYRLMYLEGGSISLQPSNEISKLTLGDYWEHQVRAGVRYNIW